MKPSRRDRALVATAVALVLLTAGLVLTTVRRAEQDGTRALQELQLAQVQQLTRSMDSRIASIFDSLQGLASGPPAWRAALRDRQDAARLAQLQALNPKARTGFFLVDMSGTVTNGTLLRDPASVGRRYERQGLDTVLGGKPAILPVGPGLTTAVPVVVVGFPLRDVTGRSVVGAMLIESDVYADSAFNAEVSQLKRGRTGEFSFVDEAGMVVASSNTSLLGQRLDEPLLGNATTGFHRVRGRVVVIEPVTSAGWRTVFRQDVDEFEGALTGPLRSALGYVVAAGLLGAGMALVLLARRLRRAREEQRRLEEISAVREEFISIVSHELRTPVAGLLGFLQTTLDHWEVMTDDERRRAVTRSLSSARRLHALTRDVLDTTNLETGGMPYTIGEFDLRTEIASAIEAERAMRPDRLLSLELSDTPAWVRCDPERVQQVLTNLLDNALKSSPPDTAVEISVSTSGGGVEVAVRDHGPGLSDSELARVFEKFVRGRTSTPTGTGLGLYICRQLVEAQGGSIRAERGEDGGARFVFTLPLMTAQPVG